MASKKNKTIAILIQSEVQFFSLAPVLKKLNEEPYEVFVLTDDFKEDKNGYNKMAEGVLGFLKKNGISPKILSEYKNFIFDLCITPYVDGKIKAKCYLKYEYGTLNIKPSLTYLPCFMERVHGFLCQSTITANLLSVYGKTFLVDNLRFCGLPKKVTKEKKDRKVVLFAPTFNDGSNEKEFEDILTELRKHYYVIVKSHHGTEYLKNNEKQRTILKELSDEYYGSEARLTDLILKSDVCLFGNSSAVAEAVYAKVPCAVFCKDLDYFRLGDLHTTLHNFAKEGFIPVCSKPENVAKTIECALNKETVKLQKELAEKIFPESLRTGVDGYIKVIKYFLDNPEAKEYVIFHDYVVKEKYDKLKEIGLLREKNSDLAKRMVEQEELLEDFSKRKLYKVADTIYKIEGKILHGKN